MPANGLLRSTLVAMVFPAMLALSGCFSEDPQHDPSGLAIGTPPANEPFDDYVQKTREQLRTALKTKRFDNEAAPFGQYDLDQVVAMRAPFASGPDISACDAAGNDTAHGKDVGFLMVHGLTDSPFLMTDIRNTLQTRFPCATFHAVLLPGHGTVPGDLRDVSYEDWVETVHYGMNSFPDTTDKIIPIGYSTGATLIGREFDAHHQNSRMTAMIMLSPGFATKSKQAWLAPYARYVQSWVGQDENSDAAKYGSMAMNAAAEFYLLTEPYRDGTIGEFDIPVFMVASSDDQTVDPVFTANFFCDKVDSNNKRLIWYQGEEHLIDEHPLCDGVDIVKSAAPDWRTLSHAHTAITMRPDNPHYGMDGVIRRCDHYDEQGPNSKCQTSSDAVYGELNLAESASPGSLRRGTFNPDFVSMLDKITHFIEVSLEVPGKSEN